VCARGVTVSACSGAVRRSANSDGDMGRMWSASLGRKSMRAMICSAV
jgi:hypothetical protein